MLQLIDIFPKQDTAGAPRAKQLGEQPHIHPTARIRKSRLGAWSDIGPNCTLLESSVGDYSYLAGDAAIIYSEIGKFCSIASHVTINPGNHPMSRVTQHHCTYRRVQYGLDDHDDEGFFNWRRDDPCIIGHDVWIGHGALVVAGVRIGTGAVVGAGAVVTKDVAPYEVVVGVPAKPIRKRFSEDAIQKLLRVAWWEWDRPTLEERFHDLLDLDAFLVKYA
jgi:phosphonate metabolism protein (transferase hexapeptide repeat family)